MKFLLAQQKIPWWPRVLSWRDWQFSSQGWGGGGLQMYRRFGWLESLGAGNTHTSWTRDGGFIGRLQGYIKEPQKREYPQAWWEKNQQIQGRPSLFLLSVSASLSLFLIPPPQFSHFCFSLVLSFTFIWKLSLGPWYSIQIANLKGQHGVQCPPPTPNTLLKLSVAQGQLDCCKVRYSELPLGQVSTLGHLSVGNRGWEQTSFVFSGEGTCWQRGCALDRSSKWCLLQLDRIMTVYWSFTLYQTLYCLKMEIKTALIIP